MSSTTTAFTVQTLPKKVIPIIAKAPTTIEAYEDPESAFEQLRNFRRLIPRDILIQWEKPTGLVCSM